MALLSTPALLLFAGCDSGFYGGPNGSTVLDQLKIAKSSTVTVPHCYSAGPRTIQVATGTAVWYRVGLPVVSLRWVLIRDPQQQFRPQALLSTNLDVVPGQAIQWFVRHWQMETTWAEVRAKLVVETQRQWSELAIARTTPCLLALFSLITLLASDLHQCGQLPIRQSAWYRKTQLTFSDTIAAVR